MLVVAQVALSDERIDVKNARGGSRVCSKKINVV